MRKRERASGRSSTFPLTTTERTGRQADKDIETLEQWIQAYPRDTVPQDNLALAEQAVGQAEKALANASEALRLNPKDPYAYQNVAAAYLALNRYDEAKAVAEQAIAQKAEPWSIHITLYQVGVHSGRRRRHAEELEHAAGKVEEPVIVLQHAPGECALGKIKDARASFARGVSVAQAQGRKEFAAMILGAEAFCDAGVGFPARSSPVDECGAGSCREH